jgi:hypothetical protein
MSRAPDRLSRREESVTIRRRPPGPGDRSPMNLISERLDVDGNKAAAALAQVVAGLLR